MMYNHSIGNHSELGNHHGYVRKRYHPRPRQDRKGQG